MHGANRLAGEYRRCSSAGLVQEASRHQSVQRLRQFSGAASGISSGKEAWGQALPHVVPGGMPIAFTPRQEQA
jgi:hypothetical protein